MLYRLTWLKNYGMLLVQVAIYSGDTLNNKVIFHDQKSNDR